MGRIQIGGEIDRNHATFGLWHEALEPDVLTSALSLTPSRAFEKGDPTPSTHRDPNLRYRRGTWLLVSTLPEDVPLDRHLRHLLDQLHPRADQIQTFVRGGYDARITCGLFLKRWNHGTELLPSTIGRIAALGVGFGLDIYGPDGAVDAVDDDDETG